MDDMFFTDYCIVCDRAIIAPKEPETLPPLKKKAAAGTISVKNPDGTVTTRTATGQKTTRPPLRRGPNSANRLAAVAAANNTTSTKFQPLTRSKTAEPAARAGAAKEATGSHESSASPESVMLKTPASAAAKTPFLSSIYCSRACADIDVSRSTDLARQLSYEYTSPGLHVVTSGLSINGSPAPPSPLYISESDSSSNPDAPRSAEPGASSAPNPLSFFQMHRDNADEAWRDVNKQRRSSIHPSFRPLGMAREPSQASTTYSIPGLSSDSLNSMWNGGNEQDREINLGRSTSGSGKIRMTPMSEAQAAVAGRRASSTSCDRAAIPPVRPLPRSTLSQVSLTATSPSAPISIPPEFGSAPEHTLTLWNTFHNSFQQRTATGTSASRGYQLAGHTPTMSPQPGQSTQSSRRASQTGAGLQRPVGGTIRAKSRTDVTWDSFGYDEVMAHKKRQERISSVEAVGQTPKQTIQIGQGGCIISYAPVSSYSSRRASSSTRSHSASGDEDDSHFDVQHAGALAIPRSNQAGTSISPARTPTGMLPPANIPARRTGPGADVVQVPDLASLRIGSANCGVSGTAQQNSSAPRSTWNWSKWEQEGGKTYPVPEGLLKGNSSSGKTGLFFFK